MWGQSKHISKIPYCGQRAVAVTVIVNVTVTVVNTVTVELLKSPYLPLCMIFLLGMSGWLVIFKLVNLPDF